MIEVNYIRLESGDTGVYFKRLLEALPQTHQKTALRYHRTEDQMRFVLARHLTLLSLQQFGYPADSLLLLQKDKFNRPYINNRIDFNITHSGVYVICAINSEGKIGIDVEEIHPIQTDEFEGQFHPNEKLLLHQSKNPLHQFYHIWTKKEAVCKAHGKGITAALNQIDTCPVEIPYEGVCWKTLELPLTPGYVAHLAASDIPKKPAFNQISLFQLDRNNMHLR
jgi:4'-phosphopantetheinyl transferase